MRLCCIFLILLTAACTKNEEKWELVIHAQGGKIMKNQLILEGLSQYASAFTVSQPRKVREIPIREVVHEWDKLFAKSQPNASLSFITKEGEQKEQLVILEKPKFHNGWLEFSIYQISSIPEGTFGEAAISIENHKGI